MANITIHDLQMCDHLDTEARTAIRGGTFGVFGFIVPYEFIGASRRGGGNTFNILNILVDQLVVNNITNTSILDVDVTEVNNTSVAIEAPQIQLGSAQNNLNQLVSQSIS